MDQAQPPSARWELARVLLNRDARQLTPHEFRLGALLLLFLFVVLPASQSTTVGAPGLGVLRSIVICAAVWVIAAGMAGFISLLNDEWTGYNLELLRLTGMSAADLVWAKGIPQLATVASGVVLSFPMALLSVTLGGVALVQVGAIYVQLLVLISLVAVSSLLAGTLLKDLANARIMAVGLMVAYGLCTLGADLFVFQTMNFRTPPTQPQWCLLTECVRVLDSRFVGPIASWPVLLHLMAGAGLLVVTRRWMAWNWERAADQMPSPTVSEEQPKQPQPLWRPALPPPRCSGNPIVWKDYYFLSGGDEMQYGKWLFLLVPLTPNLVCLWMGLGDSRGLRVSGVVFVVIGFFSIFAAIGVITFTAQRLWQTEIQERTLGSLALLPWEPWDMITAKLRVLALVSAQEMVIFAATLLGLLLYRQWIGAGLLAALLLSLPMIVCTDAAWRFIPRTWEGLTSRGKLVGAPVVAWSLGGLAAYFAHPLAGLAMLAVCVPFVCWIAIDDCAARFAQHAGEVSDQ